MTIEEPRTLQAVILAAGYGRRMSPLSDECHKALLSVGGTTILGRIMDSLDAVGIDRVTVVTGYRADEVEGFVRQRYPSFDLRFVNNDRYRDTNNIVSLFLALDGLELDADVVLIECDLLFEPSLLRQLIESPWPNVALLDHYRTGMDGTVVSVRDGYVSSVYTTDVQGADFSYEGKFKTLNIYRFDKEFCRTTLRPLLGTYSQHVDPSVYYEVVLAMLSNVPAHRIRAEVVAGERWTEVDDPNDLTVASFHFEPERRAEILDGAFGGHWNFDVLDFSFMRNAYFPTGAMLAAMRHALPELVSNYGSAQQVLNTKLSYVLHCDPSHVQVLHGATQAFPILGRMLSTTRAAVPNPTFGEYGRVFPEAEHYEDRPGVDWSVVEDLAKRNSVCVIVNPNTPTGTLLPSRAIWSLAEQFSETVFWVDESFLAFSGEPSLLTLLEREPLDNIIVLTSLSKCLGTPGLRLGHLYSTNHELIESVGAELPVWNLSAPAEFLLELLVKFGSAYAEAIERTRRDTELLASQLADVAIVEQVHPSGGDFVLMRLRGETWTAAATRRWLLEHHRIEVKDVTGRFSDRAPRLRIATRIPEENALLIEALMKVRPGQLQSTA
jgi:histidinol-phosphate/aromatic aminotransferase/cobyric acid decarboxylase-like protein/choline kinase